MNSIIRRAFAVAVLVRSVTGARIKEHAAGEQAGPPEFTVKEAQLVTPDGSKISWSKGALFACVLKWEKAKTKMFRMATAVKKEEQWTGKTCLADVEDVMRGQKAINAARAEGKDTPLIRGSKNFQNCQSLKNPWMLKLCPLKGKKDVRLSYSHKVHVPKSAFFGAQVLKEFAKTGIPMAKVAVDLNGLMKEMQKSPEGQAAWKTEDTLLVPKLARPVEAQVELDAKEEDEPEEEVEVDDDDVTLAEAADNFVDLENLDFDRKLDLWAERDDGRAVQPGPLVTGGLK